MENANVKDNVIHLTVAFAMPDQQVLKQVTVPAGATVQDAIQQSGFLHGFPQIDIKRNSVGIYGVLAKLSDVVHEGDRVEIYRSLIADPKSIRRQRAKQQDRSNRKHRG